MTESSTNKLPETWELTDIGTVYEVVGGGTPATTKEEFWNGDVPWITSADIGGVRHVDVTRFVTDRGIEGSATNKVPVRTLLVVTRVGLGKIAIADREICFSQDIQGLVQNPDLLLPEYALYYLSYQLQRLKYEGRGTTISGLTKKQLKDTDFPLAPRSEQFRIVAKIEEFVSELDKGVESLKTVRGQLKAYRHAVLRHAFSGRLTIHWREKNKDTLQTVDKLLGQIEKEREKYYSRQLEEWRASVKEWESNQKPGKKPPKPRVPKPVTYERALELPELPYGWAWESIGNLNTEIFDGPFGSNLRTSDYVSDGVRVIRLENVGDLEFIDDKVSFISENKYETLMKHTVRSGDVIFSSFVTDGIRVTVLPSHVERAVNKADCFCIRLHGHTVSADFLASFLSSRMAFKQIESEIHGVGRPRINTTQLKSFAIPLCSPEEQSQVMRSLSDQLSLIEYLELQIDNEIERLASLHQSILMQAFSGKLVEQDPNDEPAIVLLEAIKAENEKRVKILKKRKKLKKRKDAA